MALVHSCTHAYEHKEGWTDEEPPMDMHIRKRPEHLVPADPVKQDNAPREFYDKPPPQGYFYANNKVNDLLKINHITEISTCIFSQYVVFMAQIKF